MGEGLLAREGAPYRIVAPADVAKQLKLKDVTLVKAPYGKLPDLSQVDAAGRAGDELAPFLV